MGFYFFVSEIPPFVIFFFVCGLVGGENKQKNMGGEGRNRRVLQDIGNLVGKQGHGNGINVSKPVTRFFLFSFLLKCFIFLSSHNFSSVFFCLILLFSFLLGTFVLNYWPMQKLQQKRTRLLFSLT